MEWVCGIDVSSLAIDLCWIPANPEEEAPPYWVRLDLGKKGDAFDRARRVKIAYDSRVTGPQEPWPFIWGLTLVIGIEQPFGKGLLSTAAGYRVQGAMLAMLPPDTLMFPMNPNTWKAKAGIGGTANKEKIREWFETVQNIFEVEPGARTEDELDSLGVALATRIQYRNQNRVS